MNTLKIENYQVSEISEIESMAIQGGNGIWSKIVDATIGYVVGEVIDGIAEGLSRKCPPTECK